MSAYVVNYSMMRTNSDIPGILSVFVKDMKRNLEHYWTFWHFYFVYHDSSLNNFLLIKHSMIKSFVKFVIKDYMSMS